MRSGQGEGNSDSDFCDFLIEFSLTDIIMSKLWIIGDSFWCRNSQANVPITGGSWVDTFVLNCELDFNWGSNTWCIGGASNDWLAYGLDYISNDSCFDIDNDVIILGFTKCDRRVVCRNSSNYFDASLGWDNLRHTQGTTIAHTRTMSLMYEKSQDPAYFEYIQSHMWKPDMFKTELAYSMENLDLEWLQYMHCSLLDGVISKAKSRGVNIIPHRGCMYLYTDEEIQLKDSKYNWHNTEIFDVPSFQIGLEADRQERLLTEKIDENDLPMDQRWHNKYSSHMSPVGSKAYGDAFSNWWNNT